MRIGLASWIQIRIRIDVKSCILIRIETNVDLKHWLPEIHYCSKSLSDVAKVGKLH